MDTNDIDNALHELRQMTILGLRVLESTGEKFRQDYEEASEALSFCLNDILSRLNKLDDVVQAAQGK